RQHVSAAEGVVVADGENLVARAKDGDLLAMHQRSNAGMGQNAIQFAYVYPAHKDLLSNQSDRDERLTFRRVSRALLPAFFDGHDIGIGFVGVDEMAEAFEFVFVFEGCTPLTLVSFDDVL